MANRSELQLIIESVFKERGVKLAERELHDLEGALKQVETTSSRTQTAFRGLGGILAGAGLTFGATEVLGFFQESINLAEEQAKAEAQLEAVIKSTGGAAGVTADEVKQMAAELQALTNFGDEATIKGQNLLLTFKNIGEDVFPQATRTMLDMAVALEQGVGASAKQLGKALDDPITGVSALREAGVSFTQEQQNLIRILVETGQVAEAQKLILEELNSQVGGSAEAARESSTGFEALTNAIGDLQEVIGAQAVPATQSWTDAIRESVEAWTFVLGEALPAMQAVNNEIIEANNAQGAHWTELGALLADEEERRKAVEKITREEAEAKRQAAQASRLAALAQHELNLELEQSERATSAAAARYQGLANAYRTNPTLVKQKQDLEDIRLAHLERVEAEEEAQKQQDQLGKSISTSLRSAANEMSSIISSAIRPTLDEVWKPPESAQNIDEAARRLATVSTAGFGSEWLNQLNQQFAGMSFWQPIAEAMAAGDEGALKEAANNILTNQVTKLWDKELIKQQVRQSLQQQQLRDALIQEVQQELGAEGVTASIGVITAAAGDTTAATDQVKEGLGGVEEKAVSAGETMAQSMERANTAALILEATLKRIVGITDMATEGMNNMADAAGRAGANGNNINQNAGMGGAAEGI